jgi:hypothetical protein
MTERDKKIADLLADIESVEAAMHLAVRDALIIHKAMGNPVATWKDDRVVWIPADQIRIPDEKPAATNQDSVAEAPRG